ncbi:type III-A CRISPR-associated protein Csm2 [Thermodesulfobium sp. 4217-1]|uniref:type III-A CRISPR-associated protein Csm2 n=1 Tax=Thermodesulfobium sp. 4217-1 TaxID=3120013 RepID=UPI00322206D3
MPYKPNRPNVSSAQRPNGQQSNSRQNFQQSSARDNNDFVEFSYKDPDEFLKKSEEFARKLAGDGGKDLGKSQLRKFYDQVISLRDEVLQKSFSDERIEVDNIIFRLKLLQARVIYLANRKSGNGFLIAETAKKYLLGILERGIFLCKNEKEVNEALKRFAMEFEAIYAYFYAYAKD